MINHWGYPRKLRFSRELQELTHDSGVQRRSVWLSPVKCRPSGLVPLSQPKEYAHGVRRRAPCGKTSIFSYFLSIRLFPDLPTEIGESRKNRGENRRFATTTAQACPNRGFRCAGLQHGSPYPFPRTRRIHIPKPAGRLLRTGARRFPAESARSRYAARR